MLGADVDAVFRYDGDDQQWLRFSRTGPSFINRFTMADRLQGLFILNEGIIHAAGVGFHAERAAAAGGLERWRVGGRDLSAAGEGGAARGGGLAPIVAASRSSGWARESPAARGR